MNCGLGNLTSLKNHLLAKSMAAETRFDEVIADIGRGNTALMERFTGRKFARAVNTTEIFPADRCTFLVARFPIESVSQSEYKQTETDGWVVQATDFIEMIDHAPGIIATSHNADVGLPHEQVRFTFTGGYHIEFLEPSEGTTDLPANATALPDDLRLAWLIQSRLTWTAIDKLGAGVVKEGPSGQFVTGGLSDLKLSPKVEQILAPYKRYALV
jgi:hypothetical protein